MRRIIAGLVVSCLCLLLCSCVPLGELPEDVLLRVIFLDVGQGDSILLRTREGDVLIDAGPEDSQEALCERLRYLGVEHLRLVVFTHPDEDHIGGADGVLAAFPAEEIWLPETDTQNEALSRMYRVISDGGMKLRFVEEGELFHIGDVVLCALSPLYGMEADSNDSSIVLKVTCGNAKAILSGDAGVAVEARLAERYGREHLDCELYKAGHHGSSTSSSEVFLEQMTPMWAVISCGKENSFGHPHGEVIVRLKRIGAEVLRTDRLGEIVFDCDGEGFEPLSDDWKGD